MAPVHEITSFSLPFANNSFETASEPNMMLFSRYISLFFPYVHLFYRISKGALSHSFVGPSVRRVAARRHLSATRVEKVSMVKIIRGESMFVGIHASNSLRVQL